MTSQEARTVLGVQVSVAGPGRVRQVGLSGTIGRGRGQCPLSWGWPQQALTGTLRVFSEEAQLALAVFLTPCRARAGAGFQLCDGNANNPRDLHRHDGSPAIQLETHAASKLMLK